MVSTRIPTLLLLATLAGCGHSCAPEGRYAGECSDAADNDGDGLFDCEDGDCAGSPDCAEGPDDTGTTDTHDSEPDPYTYEEFVDDYVLAICDKLGECGLFTDEYTYEDCLDSGDELDTGHTWECEDFDSALARTCLEQLAVVSCEDLTAGVGYPACEEYCSNL